MGDGEATFTIHIKDDGGPSPGPSYAASSATGYSTPSGATSQTAATRAATGAVRTTPVTGNSSDPGESTRQAQQRVIQQRVAARFAPGPMDAKEQAEFEGQLVRIAQENILRRRVARKTTEVPMSSEEMQLREKDAIRQHKFEKNVLPIAKMATGIGSATAAGGYFAAGKPIQGAIATYVAAKTLRSGMVDTAKALGIGKSKPVSLATPMGSKKVAGAPATVTSSIAGATTASAAGTAVASGGALAAISAAALPVAVFAAGIGAAGVAVKKFTDVMSAETRRAASFSPEAALAVAETDLRRQRHEMKSAATLGPKLARFEKTRGGFEEMFADTWMKFQGIALEIFEMVKPILDISLPFLRAATEWMEATMKTFLAMANGITGHLPTANRLLGEAIVDIREGFDELGKIFKDSADADELRDPWFDEFARIGGGGLVPSPLPMGGP